MLQQYLPACTRTHEGFLQTFCNYNNYSIFKYAFWDLLHNNDIYVLHQPQTWDYYKYSPTFAMFFGIFAILPDWLGLFCWHLFNSFCIIWSVKLLIKGLDNQSTFKGVLTYCHDT